MSSRITADDFFAGLFAALARRGETSFSIRVDQFDPVIKNVYDDLEKRAGAEGVQLRFRIQPHPVHKDSLTVQGALARAAQRDLISFDNPEYQDIRIKLASEEAEKILAGLPGRPGLYEDLAERFVCAYSGEVDPEIVHA
jgi:light-regulated signal transduction histidine kinase (bacteriophytochrome)